MGNKNHRCRLALIALLLILTAGWAFADSQWDIALNVPYYMGVSTDNGDFGSLTDGFYPVPSVEWHHYFGSETLHFGPGLKLWTLIVETAVYPVVTMESVLGDFVLNASIGGGAFLMLGVYSGVPFESLFLPEISVSYRMGKKKRFSLGAGTVFFIAPGVADLDEFGFAGTALARFTL